MAIKEILVLGNPVLRKRCKRVTDFTKPELARTIKDLRDTLENFRRKNGFGRGIAAPQIGVSLRIIFINVERPMALVNPRITRSSKSAMTLWDDCFSFPDLLVKVKRNRNITISYQDETGARHLLTASDDRAELLQHEIDHLDGILAVDRAVSSRHIILRSEYERMRATQHELHSY